MKLTRKDCMIQINQIKKMWKMNFWDKVQKQVENQLVQFLIVKDMSCEVVAIDTA